MTARLSAIVIWALAAVSAVAWGLKIFTQPLTPSPRIVTTVPLMVADDDWSRVLGARPPPPVTVADTAAPLPPESARFRLVGVVAPAPEAARSEGVALISVDGKFARAYRVGAVVDGEQVLLSVRRRAVEIGPREGQGTVTLELQAMPPSPSEVASTLPPAVAPSTPPPGLPTGVGNSGPSPPPPSPVGGPPSGGPMAAPVVPNPGMFPAGRRRASTVPVPAPPPGPVPHDPDPEPPPSNDARATR